MSRQSTNHDNVDLWTGLKLQPVLSLFPKIGWLINCSCVYLRACVSDDSNLKVFKQTALTYSGTHSYTAEILLAMFTKTGKQISCAEGVIVHEYRLFHAFIPVIMFWMIIDQVNIDITVGHVVCKRTFRDFV